MDPLLIAGINFAGNTLGNLFSQSQGYANWQMQQDYNSPANQMKRFIDAGLNPNLIYGAGTPGNASSAPPTPDYSKATNDIGSIIQAAKMNAVEIQKQQQTIENLKTQVAMMKDNQELIKANTELRGAQQTSLELYKNPNLASSTELNLSLPGYHNQLIDIGYGNLGLKSQLLPYEQQRMSAQSALAGSNITVNDARIKQLTMLAGLEFQKTANEVLQNKKLSIEMPFLADKIASTIDLLKSRTLLGFRQSDTQLTLQALNKATQTMRYFQDGKLTTSALKDVVDMIQKFVGGSAAAGMLGSFGF